jgi:hypothetical protein
MAMPIGSLAFLVSNCGYTMNTWNAAHVISNYTFPNSHIVLIVNEIDHVIFILTNLMAQFMILSE